MALLDHKHCEIKSPSQRFLNIVYKITKIVTRVLIG